jgi:hypothetical protein
LAAQALQSSATGRTYDGSSTTAVLLPQEVAHTSGMPRVLGGGDVCVRVLACCHMSQVTSIYLYNYITPGTIMRPPALYIINTRRRENREQLKNIHKRNAHYNNLAAGLD